MRLPTLYVASDLHLDSGQFIWPVEAREADIVVIPGDLANGDDFPLAHLSSLNKPVVLTLGNHDFWTKHPQRTLSVILDEVLERTKGTQIHVLHNSECTIQGVRFIGTPLWTSFGGGNTELMHAAGVHMRDYHLSYFKEGELDASERRHSGWLTPEHTYALHQEAVAYLGSALSQDSGLPTVVVTHMAPSMTSLKGYVDPHYLDPANWYCRGLDNLNLANVGAYASDLTDLILAHQPAMWVHGHIHRRCDYTIGQTRICCNPRGRHLPPLTAQDAAQSQWYGLRITQAMIDESIEACAKNPNRGSGYGFDQGLQICMGDVLSPVFEAQLPEVQKTLTALAEECRRLIRAMHVSDWTAKRCVEEVFALRSTAFARRLTEFLQPVVAAFASDTYSLAHEPLAQALDMLGFPALTSPEVTTWALDHQPITTARLSLKRMNQLISALPELCRPLEHWRRDVRSQLKKIEAAAAAGGIAVHIRGKITEQPTTLPHIPARVYIDAPREDMASWITRLDRVANPKIPRRYLIEFCSIEDAADWDDEVPAAQHLTEPGRLPQVAQMLSAW